MEIHVHTLTGMTVTELRHHRDLAWFESQNSKCLLAARHLLQFGRPQISICGIYFETVAKMKIIVGALAALTGVAAFAPRSLRYGQHRHESNDTSWSRYPKRAGPALAAGVSEMEPLHRANGQLDNPCLKCLTLN
jgi:hypothetical protein